MIDYKLPEMGPPSVPLLVFSKEATLEEIQKRAILWTLELVGGNRTKAADILNISVRGLRNKLAQYREAVVSV